MKRTFSGEAFAKLNLYLGVSGLREDGYHELETVFQSVDLCDLVSLTLHKQGGISLRCNLPYLPCDGRNLAVRAAELFFRTAGIENPGVNINIKKRIPVGAGMAGGSTDAACVLRLLNRAYGKPLSDRVLSEAALTLGADVPFCLRGGTALATGVGEKLRQLRPMPDCRIVAVKPSFSVSTKAAFALFDERAREKAPGAAQMLSALENGSTEAIARALYNSLEAPVAEQEPLIARLRDVLAENGALGARMTGSGSAVFGIFADTETAQAAAQKAEALCRNVYLTAPRPRLED